MRPPAFALLAAVLSLAFAPAPLPRPAKHKDDLTQAQGMWLLVSEVVSGHAQNLRPLHVRIQGDRLSFIVKGVTADEWFITLDSKKAPKHLNMRRIPNGPPNGALGTYTVAGDLLTLNINFGGPRPADLTGGRPNERMMMFKREKR
jgi:uncharacterized protein (TIGR03067 family)